MRGMEELQAQLDAAFPKGVRVCTDVTRSEGRIFWAARAVKAEGRDIILVSPVGSDIVTPYEYESVEFVDGGSEVLFYAAHAVGSERVGTLRLDTKGDPDALKAQIEAEREAISNG